jgi:hypothetical protein
MDTIEKHTIFIEGDLKNKGFGFMCMQMAYQLNLGGTLHYESGNSATLEISGEEDNIKNVLSRCKRENYILHVHILKKTKANNKTSDFIILNQI